MPSASLRFTHQVKLSSSFWNTRSRNARSPTPRLLLVDLVDAPRRPGVHRRIHIAERPLVRGQLPVGVHVPLAQQQHELLLREVGIDERQRHAVERQIPGRVPGILPLVRHRDDVGVVEVRPLVIAAAPALGRRRRLQRIAVAASRSRRSDRTASTRAGRQTPAATTLAASADSVGGNDVA